MRLTELQLAAIQAKQGTMANKSDDGYKAWNSKPQKPKPVKHIEDDHQRTLISWSNYTRLDPLKHPVFPGSTLSDYLFSIPNGGKRNEKEAARLVGLGVRAGIPDLMLSLPCGNWHGLYIEMKRPIVPGAPKPEVSTKQMDKLQRFSHAGYCCRVAYGCDQAQQIIKDYLADKLTEPLITDYS